MADLLSAFSDTGWLSNLLGPEIFPAANASPPPSPPPNVMAGAGPAFSPNSAMGTIPAMGGAPAGPTFGGPPPGPTPNETVADRFPEAGSGRPGPLADARPALEARGLRSPYELGGPANSPSEAFGRFPSGPVAPPPGGPPGAGPPAGPPMPPPEAMPPGGAPPTSVTGAGLPGAFGLPPEYADSLRKMMALKRAQLIGQLDPRAKMLEQGTAALGRGLSAVGAQRPGATGAASFAAGAGGALQGGTAQANTQQAQERQAVNDMFNMHSSAAHDFMAAHKLGNEDQLTRARINYMNSLAAMRASGVPGSNAWQNTPYGKAQNLEKMLDSWEQNQMKYRYMSKWNQAKLTMTPEEFQAMQQKDLAELGQARNAERTRRAQGMGIDPNTWKSGLDKANAFDFDRLGPQQRALVGDGFWYKYKDPKNPDADKDGYVYKQRDWLSKPPHEAWHPGEPGTPPAPPPPSGYEIAGALGG